MAAGCAKCHGVDVVEGNAAGDSHSNGLKIGTLKKQFEEVQKMERGVDHLIHRWLVEVFVAVYASAPVLFCVSGHHCACQSGGCGGGSAQHTPFFKSRLTHASSRLHW